MCIIYFVLAIVNHSKIFDTIFCHPETSGTLEILLDLFTIIIPTFILVNSYSAMEEYFEKIIVYLVLFI